MIMIAFLKDMLEFILNSLLQELVVTIAGVLFALLIRRAYFNWRYGRWQVILRKGDEIILTRLVSAEKARECLSDASDKAVFLKGIVSPYAHLTIDIVERGPKIDLLLEDKRSRRWVIDLDKNPLGDTELTVE
jgi:hypothetical protein